MYLATLLSSSASSNAHNPSPSDLAPAIDLSASRPAVRRLRVFSMLASRSASRAAAERVGEEGLVGSWSTESGLGAEKRGVGRRSGGCLGWKEEEYEGELKGEELIDEDSDVPRLGVLSVLILLRELALIGDSVFVLTSRAPLRK